MSKDLQKLPSGSEALEAFQENLGGQFDPNLLTKIRCPKGKDTLFQIEGIDGPEGAKALKGIPIAFQKIRTFWGKDFSESDGSPPECQSPDSKVGIGEPGGICAGCEKAQFNAKAGIRSQCREYILIFLLAEGTIIPDIVVVSPASLRSWSEFTMLLTKWRIPYFKTKIEITAETAKNKAGIEYAKLKFKRTETLSDKEFQEVSQLRRTIIEGGNQTIDITETASVD